MVIDADGRRTPWPDVSRIGNEKMGRQMRQVVNRLYTFHAKANDLHFVAMMDRALVVARRWDEPELDEIILSATAPSRWRSEEGNGECGSKPLSRQTSQSAPYALSIGRIPAIGQPSPEAPVLERHRQ